MTQKEAWGVFINHSLSFYPLSAKAQQSLESFWQYRKIKKGEVILNEGQTCKMSAFVVKGIFRSFLFTEDKECTYEFFPENHYAVDYESFAFQSPATFGLEALEECEILALNADDFANLQKNHIEFQLLTKAIIERKFTQMLNLSRALRFQNPLKRYETFLQHFPSVPNRVPQYMIASYLGIKPETLSRVRRRLAKEGK
jgi:CRP-like cAMP-binding protein